MHSSSYNKHKHHVDYNKDKVVNLCASCHRKAHNPQKYPELKFLQPVGTRKEMLEKEKEKKKRYCVVCNVLLTGRKMKYCSPCKSEKLKEEERQKASKRKKRESKWKDLSWKEYLYH